LSRVLLNAIVDCSWKPGGFPSLHGDDASPTAPLAPPTLALDEMKPTLAASRIRAPAKQAIFLFMAVRLPCCLSRLRLATAQTPCV
jgi:hypothetical protein